MVKHKLYMNAHWMTLDTKMTFFQRSEIQDGRHYSTSVLTKEPMGK